MWKHEMKIKIFYFKWENIKVIFELLSKIFYDREKKY